MAELVALIAKMRVNVASPFFNMSTLGRKGGGVGCSYAMPNAVLIQFF